jgi:hypothetical protein
VKQAKADAERREAELAVRFGGSSTLQGRTAVEQRGIWLGAAMTALLTGSPVCHSLAETAKTGGC